MHTHGVERIQRLSKRLRVMFVVMMFGVPLLDAGYWLFFNHLPQSLMALPFAVSQPPSFLIRTLAFLVSLLPVGIATYGVYTLARLFALYQEAVIFTTENVKLFRRLGYTLLLWVIARLVYLPLLSLVLTFNNPPGERTMVAGFYLLDITALVTGAVVLLIAWVMEEGRRLEDEQAHTI